MGKQARVTSIEVLREARAALQVFETNTRAALSEVDADVQRTTDWLRMQQLPHWQKQIRERSEALAQARSDLLRKQLSSMQDSPSCVDEQRAVARAKQRLESAQQRLQVVRKWITVWEREATLYKGQTQALSDTLARDIPAAVQRLDRMGRALAGYVAIAPARVDSATGRVSGGDDAGPPPPEPESPAVRFARLRRRTPGPEQRARLLVEAPAMVFTEGPPLLAEAVEPFSRLGLAEPALPPEALVLIEQGALRQGETYFERTAPVAPTAPTAPVAPNTPPDSGWFIGLSNGGPMVAEAHAIRIGDLLARRPDLTPVLACRPGCLIATVAGGVEAALDENDHDAWESWR
ncbi:MAG: hypothetical protein KIT68_10100 [Phycisphaeraceae bacterium]|nr:hypothetical protein [Phycisphaeraceae bacterium]